MTYGTYRTKTYIAADWTGDKNAVDQLYKWKEGRKGEREKERRKERGNDFKSFKAENDIVQT